MITAVRRQAKVSKTETIVLSMISAKSIESIEKKRIRFRFCSAREERLRSCTCLASSSLRRASSIARVSAERDSECGCSSVPSSSATEISNTSARRIRSSASGTERLFSHFDTVCRTTFRGIASSSWLIFFSFRYFLIWSPNISKSPFTCRLMFHCQYKNQGKKRQATQVNMEVLSWKLPCSGDSKCHLSA